MFVVLFAHDAWLWLVAITGVMILPPYLASTGFLWRYATKPEFVTAHGHESKQGALISGVLGSVYAVWLLYAAGLQFILLSTIVFALGIPVYWYAQKQKSATVVFNRKESIAAGLLVLAAAASVVLIATGTVGIG